VTGLRSILSFGPKRNLRESGLIATTAFMFLTILIFFQKLWLADRAFPNVPVFRFLADAPVWVHAGIFYLAIAFAVLLLVTARLNRAVFIWPFVLTFSASWFLDVLRLQPQLYLGYIFLILLAVDRNKANLQRVIIFVYFWAGLQKLNFGWTSQFFPRALKSFEVFSGLDVNSFPIAVGVSAALFESLIGLMLLLPKTRNMGVLAATALHLFILLLLGPLNGDMEPFVWPWNAWMICVVWLLFIDEREKTVFFNRGFTGHIVTVLFLIGPLSNFAGWWNDYLAFKIYSGNVRAGYILYPPESKYQEDPIFEEITTRKRGINISSWGFADVGANHFPSDWYFKDFFWQICRKLNVPSGEQKFTLRIHTVEGFWNHSISKSNFQCE